MKLNSRLLLVSLILSCLAALSTGCSESTKPAEPLVDIVFPVHFPFINNGSLYSIEPTIEYGVAPDSEDETNLPEHKLLFDFPVVNGLENPLILALDIDQSTKSNEEITEESAQTPLPEFISYAKSQTLHVYDLSTRRDHEVYSFASDPFDPEHKGRYICDLQKVITLDEKNFLARIVLLKDELAVYTKTSTLPNCSDPEGNFEYWQINIEETKDIDIEENKGIYTIRRKILKEHSHLHKHFHNHDDPDYEFADIHNHPHLFQKDELDDDGLPFDPNNHIHRHAHSHEWVYGPEHAHDHLSKEEVDEIHNNPQNHEIIFEINPLLTGKRTSIDSIDEALMYSGAPIVNTDTRQFGYLGLNSQENTYKFYTSNFESLEKRQLWAESSVYFSDLTNPVNSLSDWKVLVPRYSRPFHFQYIGKHIGLYADNKFFYFTLDLLFNHQDPENDSRALRLTNPLFSSNFSSPNLSNRTLYNKNSQKMAISEGLSAWSIDFNENPPQAVRIKTYTEPALSEIYATHLGDSIAVLKTFSENNETNSSLVSLLETGLEDRSIKPRSSDIISSIAKNDTLLITTLNSDDNNLNANHYIQDFGSFLPTLLDTAWTLDTVDYRNNNMEEKISLISSDNTSFIPGTLSEPNAYFLDINAPIGRGEMIWDFSDFNISSVNNLVIFNDFYSIVEFQDENLEKIMETHIIQY